MRVEATSTASALTACSSAVPMGGSAGGASASAAASAASMTDVSALGEGNTRTAAIGATTDEHAKTGALRTSGGARMHGIDACIIKSR